MIVPACPHPVGSHRQPFGNIYTRTDVRGQGHVIEQVGGQVEPIAHTMGWFGVTTWGGGVSGPTEEEAESTGRDNADTAS